MQARAATHQVGTMRRADRKEPEDSARAGKRGVAQQSKPPPDPARRRSTCLGRSF